VSATGESVEESDLHAWVDGRLTPDREKAIETYFAAHPEVRERWWQYAEQRAALRAAFAAQAPGPVPPRLRIIWLLRE
jgi:anti-sigma factor RsiW